MCHCCDGHGDAHSSLLAYRQTLSYQGNGLLQIPRVRVRRHNNDDLLVLCQKSVESHTSSSVNLQASGWERGATGSEAGTMRGWLLISYKCNTFREQLLYTNYSMVHGGAAVDLTTIHETT